MIEKKHPDPDLLMGAGKQKQKGSRTALEPPKNEDHCSTYPLLGGGFRCFYVHPYLGK